MLRHTATHCARLQNWVRIAAMNQASYSRVRIWDLPTRIFHWALVFLVIGMVVSGLRGGGVMEWHMRMGYAVLSLLLFLLAQIGSGLMADDASRSLALVIFALCAGVVAYAVKLAG